MKRNWEYKKLGDVASFRRGLTYAKDDVVNHSSKIVLRSNNINLETSSLNFDDVVCLRDDFVIPLDKLLRGGDIFICMSNGSTQHLGKVAHVQENLNMAFGGFMGVIEPNENLTNSRYVFYCCRSGAYRSYLNSIFNGANINNLKWSDLSKFVVPVPPLEEQSRIVAELDLLTGIIDKQNAQLKELDNLAQAIFYDMFGDPIENPKRWDVKKLGDACLSITDGDHMPPPKVDQGIPFLTISDIDKETRILNFENTFHVPEEYFNSLKDDRKAQVGDLLYTVTGSYGIPVIITEKRDFCFQRHIALLRPKKEMLNTYFLCYWVLCKSVKLMADGVATGIAQKTVGLGSIRKFDVVLPPLSLQQSFAEKIQSIEKQKETIRASIADTQKLLDYTMDKYFG